MTSDGSFWRERLADYQTALQRYFRRRVDQSADIEELAQEVFLRLLRAGETTRRPVDNPEAYLFTVARNLLRERAILNRRASANVVFDEATLEIPAPAPSPEDELHRTTRDEQVASVIAGLPPRYRAVLLMHYRHDMTYREIAEQVGISVHTVKKNLARALSLCRHALRHWDSQQ